MRATIFRGRQQGVRAKVDAVSEPQAVAATKLPNQPVLSSQDTQIEKPLIPSPTFLPIILPETQVTHSPSKHLQKETMKTNMSTSQIPSRNTDYPIHPPVTQPMNLEPILVEPFQTECSLFNIQVLTDNIQLPLQANQNQLVKIPVIVNSQLQVGKGGR